MDNEGCPLCHFRICDCRIEATALAVRWCQSVGLDPFTKHVYKPARVKEGPKMPKKKRGGKKC